MPQYGAHGHRAHRTAQHQNHVARRKGKSKTHRHRHGYHVHRKKGQKHPHKGVKRKK